MSGENIGWDLPPGVLRPPDRVRIPKVGTGSFLRMGDYRNQIVYRFWRKKPTRYRDIVIQYHPSVASKDRVSR